MEIQHTQGNVINIEEEEGAIEIEKIAQIQQAQGNNVEEEEGARFTRDQTVVNSQSNYNRNEAANKFAEALVINETLQFFFIDKPEGEVSTFSTTYKI